MESRKRPDGCFAFRKGVIPPDEPQDEPQDEQS